MFLDFLNGEDYDLDKIKLGEVIVNNNDQLGMRLATQHLHSEFMILVTSLLQRGRTRG